MGCGMKNRGRTWHAWRARHARQPQPCLAMSGRHTAQAAMTEGMGMQVRWGMYTVGAPLAAVCRSQLWNPECKSTQQTCHQGG
jgi:hypothetical protein